MMYTLCTSPSILTVTVWWKSDLHGVLIRILALSNLLNSSTSSSTSIRSPTTAKVDYELAYDSVSWAFLSDMLKRLGFCPKWICWTEGCLKSASISVLVNGSPTNEFLPQRGLREGDPLAPLLFNIVAEGLTGLMREALDKGIYSSFLVGKNNTPANILQYADDTIFWGSYNAKCQDN